MNIFPQIKFNDSELQEIAAAFKSKAVVKYLNSLAYNAGADLCSAVRGTGESAESFLMRLENVRGGLVVLNTLLQISAENAEAEVSNNQQQ